MPIERFKIMEKEIDIFGNLFDDNQFNNGWENKFRIFFIYLKNKYIFASIH